MGAFRQMTFRHIPSSSLHISKPTWWLESRFHFSFADYINPSNMNFGSLRVLNDDLVKPRAGFGRHPHRDAEIFSYVVDGQLSHADSMSNNEALARGSVQYLSAGTGITHSEMNDHPSETCRFIQVWISPDRAGHKPQYGSAQFGKDARHNKLLQILAGTGAAPSWPAINMPERLTQLHQDCNVFVSEADPQKEVGVEIGVGRQAYLLCIEGSLLANGNRLAMRDAAELRALEDEAVPVTLRAEEKGAHFMLIEMARG